MTSLGAFRGVLTLSNLCLSSLERRQCSNLRSSALRSPCLPVPVSPLTTCRAGGQQTQRRPGSSQPRRFSKQADSAANQSGLLRLNKALAAAGVASRRGADEMIFAGRIAVNGAVVREPGTQINLSKDKLALDGRPVSMMAANKKYYFAMNKPKGYICSNKGDGSEGSGDRLVVDLFAEWLKGWKSRHPGSGAPPRLFTVGRLDVASVGLIFITNDGDWAQSVQHPSSELTKEYMVTLNKRPGKTELETMAAGCEIDGVQVTPVAVGIDDSDNSKTSRLRVILAEGRNREVRRLVEAAGLQVLQLRRVRIGGYRLPRTLKFGQFVELRPHEIRRVLNKGADRTV